MTNTTEHLVSNGASLIAGPVETPWKSSNSRLKAPAGLQLTLFAELESELERTSGDGFGTARDRHDAK